MGEIDSKIAQFLREHLSVKVDVQTSSFFTTNGETKTRVTVSLLLDGQEFCSDSYES